MFGQMLTDARPQDTAALWTKDGKIVKPKGKAGTGSGLHLGPGLYVTDTWSTGVFYANWNSHETHKPPKVCAVYAKSESDWRSMMTKVWMPDNLISATATEAERQKYIKEKAPHKMDTTAVKFGPLDPQRPTQHQLVIPEAIEDHFEVVCVNPTANPPAGYPTLQYSSPALKAEWKIIS
ncbi:uncharacterized protein C8Q71DRAFT_858084 [Rhodofomes roseus]|uniref:Uncharacterized protein n=1 Tax=Rhodofomes roseus TaxID=34475 RepID=A0ABQ8KFA8_9APHY|nr:uncharacterized protein C8Q71DRAFT_858084 [Rhodofomes roseus]KAH9836070.1 hypothetical protein C8Q71DRAFT_858084 [Rhodofomes roseus]